MLVFQYRAVNKTGGKKEGAIEAKDTADAVNRIKNLGYYPTHITETKKPIKKEREKKAITGKRRKFASASYIKIPFLGIGVVKGKDMVLFTRQLSTLIDADLPLVRSLIVLADQLKPGPMKEIISQLAKDVESGGTLSESMARFPRVFSKLYLNMVKAGEVGGVLEVVLERLADFTEKSQRLISRIRSAMAYPAFVVLIAISVLVFLITFIVPRFMEIFAELGSSLPVPTVMLLNLSSLFQNKWYIGLGIIVGLVLIYRLLCRSQKTRVLVDKFKLKLPVMGPLVRKISVARFSRTLGTLISSGVPILQALDITKDTAGNEVIARAIKGVHDSIREGESIAGPLEASGVFPLMVVNMIDVGEETGSIDSMLIKIADNYDEEIDTTVSALTSLLEPLLIALMGIIVGFIVAAMFLPLISLMSALGAG